MKIKVIHLFKKLESIEQDLAELKNTSSRISSERDYSGFLRESFSREMEKLESQKKEILNLSVIGAPTDFQKQRKNQPDEMKSLYTQKEKNLSSSISIETPDNPALSKPPQKKTERQPHRY
ncbi:MAG: hypothetical protein K8R21_08925 [Leptospira sp.]|nr:hypothetical protein [Leptospira sp.]